MCKSMENMRDQVQNEVHIEIAINCLKRGLDIESVAECTGLSVERVKEIGEKILVNA